MNSQVEFSASEIRKILQALFPHRRLVLSQFTFFNQVGVARPSGETFRRGRRCYRLEDILSIACILALKEEGIPYKNVEEAPRIIQESAEKIFFIGEGCRISGYGTNVVLTYPGEHPQAEPLVDFLCGGALASSEGLQSELHLFWSFDIGQLSGQLKAVAEKYIAGDLGKPAVRAAQFAA